MKLLRFVRFCRIVLPMFVAALVLNACAGAHVLNYASDVKTIENAYGLAYGEADRQKLDLYWPKQVREFTPVIVFLYGGAWKRGSRDMYRFVGEALADSGYIVAIPDYRLYPDVKFPAFVHDAAAAVAEVRKKAGSHRPLFLAGHSAGAQIGALLAFDPYYLGEKGMRPCETVNGFIGLSGPYDFEPVIGYGLKNIFPGDGYKSGQPINHANGSHPPSLLLHGARDAMVHSTDTVLMAAALRRSGNQVNEEVYWGIGHADLIGSIAPVMERVAPVRKKIVRFVEKHRWSRGGRCSV